MEAIYNFDLSVFQFISEHLWNGFLDFIMPIISITGDGGILSIIFAIVLIFFKKTRKMGIMMGAALIVMVILNDSILKPLIARPRPFDYTGWTDFVYPNKAFVVPSTYSFPSGHTSSVVACATVLMIMNKKFGTAAAIYAFLMGFSRIYLFDHYCTDVLAGIAFGIVYGLIGYMIVKCVYSIIEKRRAKNE